MTCKTCARPAHREHAWAWQVYMGTKIWRHDASNGVKSGAKRTNREMSWTVRLKKADPPCDRHIFLDASQHNWKFSNISERRKSRTPEIGCLSDETCRESPDICYTALDLSHDSTSFDEQCKAQREESRCCDVYQETILNTCSVRNTLLDITQHCAILDDEARVQGCVESLGWDIGKHVAEDQ